MGRHVVLTLVFSVLTVTDTISSHASSGDLQPAPSLANKQNITQQLLEDELIYVTNVAPDKIQSTQYNQMNQIGKTILPSNYHTSLPELTMKAGLVDSVVLETTPTVFKLRDDSDYVSLIDVSTEPTWYDDEQSNRDLTRGEIRNLHGELPTDDDHSDPNRRFHNLKNDQVPEVYVANEEDIRSQSFVIQGSGNSPDTHGVDDAYRESQDNSKVTASTVALVWGEVGRGLVAATEDYKGELGRRPLILGGNRGRARSGPYFEEDSPSLNITAPSGSTVFMDCRVAMLQDKVVTWAARRADRLQLLTVGRQAYSADPRLELSFRYPNNWRLRISRARRQDQGLYECQVAAHPPIIRQIFLTIISPEVSIWDESGRAVVERYYKAGSSLQLTCSAVQLLQPPELLAWWRGTALLSEGISCNVTGADSATCTLVVEQVTRAHAGTYTCGAFPWPGGGPAPGGATPDQPPASYANATVAVHVLHGNLIGVAVLPNTGKSVGAAGACYISVHKIIIGLSVALFIRGR